MHVEGYDIKIFNPNDSVKPDIWEGPICFQQLSSGNECIADYSLIKAVRIIKGLSVAEIDVFSGSNNTLKKISLDSCKGIE
ncbi:hypothetical protein [Aliikangiella maris]|uniref:Uncharacterized protein n=2 Tax=Aliikangiella maris TaxID=3162458 RepID=A0ABV2BZM8_9GAMM